MNRTPGDGRPGGGKTGAFGCRFGARGSRGVEQFLEAFGSDAHRVKVLEVLVSVQRVRVRVHTALPEETAS